MTLDQYREDLTHRDEVRARYAELEADCDACVSLSAPGAAPLGVDSTGDPNCTVHASLLGIPAISLPVPQDDGLPLGLQIAGFVNGDAQIFAIAAAIKPLFRAASEATGRSPREVTERRRALTLRRR